MRNRCIDLACVPHRYNQEALPKEFLASITKGEPDSSTTGDNEEQHKGETEEEEEEEEGIDERDQETGLSFFGKDL